LDKITLSNKINQENQRAIIEEFVTNGAEKYNYNYQMAEWQNCLDEGLKRQYCCIFVATKINAILKAKEI
jgi:hypothetical protein